MGNTHLKTILKSYIYSNYYIMYIGAVKGKKTLHTHIEQIEFKYNGESQLQKKYPSHNQEPPFTS